jgi:hypothetical protein
MTTGARPAKVKVPGKNRIEPSQKAVEILAFRAGRVGWRLVAN